MCYAHVLLLYYYEPCTVVIKTLHFIDSVVINFVYTCHC